MGKKKKSSSRAKTNRNGSSYTQKPVGYKKMVVIKTIAIVAVSLLLITTAVSLGLSSVQ